MSFSDYLKRTFGSGGSFVAGKGTGSLYALLNAIVTYLDEVEAALDVLKGDGMITKAVLAIGTSQNTDVKHAALNYIINGIGYQADAGEVEPDALDVIPEDAYAAWALEIGTDGTVDIRQCNKNGGLFHATEAAAIAALPARQEDHARLGYVTVVATGGDFTPGTTALTGLATYYDADCIFKLAHDEVATAGTPSSSISASPSVSASASVSSSPSTSVSSSTSSSPSTSVSSSPSTSPSASVSSSPS